MGGVVAVGALLGIAVAGLPDDAPDVVVPAAAAATSATPTTDVVAVPATVATTTSLVASLPALPTTVDDPTDTTDPTAGDGSTLDTATPTSEPATTTATSTTTAPALPPLTVRDRAEVRLVVANGDGRYNLVGRNVDRLRPLGYVEIDQTDLSNYVDRTTIYFREGFEVEAYRLADDLSVPGALVEPLGPVPVTNDDGAGDVIALLGPDAIR
ncbi:MAG: LytR C-terminal domain-containing protein [Acidimicrobiales bacterium]|nr:LytR C-terminal domain-containing protein [Acidimicrobiales bacterium]